MLGKYSDRNSETILLAQCLGSEKIYVMKKNVYNFAHFHLKKRIYLWIAIISLRRTILHLLFDC